MKAANQKIALIKIKTLSIALLILFNIFPNSQSETVTTFTPPSKFDIPELNGSISFAVNGSYSEATLKNGTWTFKDLTLKNQSIANFGINDFQSVEDLEFSTQGSNVTILVYLTVNYSFPVTLLSYTVEGEGKQTINLGLDSSSPSDATEWNVIIPDNVFLVEGQGWTLLPNNTLVITSAASNITVLHFDFRNSVNGNLPFYIEHSVALTTITMLAIVATLTIIIKVRAMKRKKESN